MKYVHVYALLLLSVFCTSCGENQTTPDTVDIKTLDPTKNVQSQKPLTNHNEKDINTKHEYTESNGARLIIQNSFPRGGLKYKDPNGKEYFYAVFWTRIINETFNPLELTIDFPADLYEIPASSGSFFKILLPSDTMTIGKEPFNDCGTLKSFLDNSIYKSSSLKRTINPKESSVFYVVTLNYHGVEVILRAGFSLKEQNLFYRINDEEIHCGKINLKNLRLWK